ncbi:MAG: DUF5591 domain-containing protein [Candidatus Thermoplasmatota archaeon]|nr:DUF5591 domain-containing protein [Candidatus Thermoplasmatota archaeon]
MNGRPLSREVVSRDRFSRLFSLGDRNKPQSWAPGLILSDLDQNLPLEIAPFTFKRDSSNLPSKLTLYTRGNLCYPFDGLDVWQSSEGLVLPPSLSSSDSGEFGHGTEFLPISWQSLHHDISLVKSHKQPSVIAITDAPQLSNAAGKLSQAIDIVRRRFPASLIWAPGISGPDNCSLLSWIGLDLFDLNRSRVASANGILLTSDGPRDPDPSLSEDSSMDSQITHWMQAIASLRSAIRSGTVREQAEKASLSSPRSVERLRRHNKLLLQNVDGSILTSVDNSGRRLRYNSTVSRQDKLIHDWRERISNVHTPPSHQSDVLVLLPCSATKPYRLSQSHHRFLKNIPSNRVHQVMVTSPLGLVPRELEDIWPAAHYDIPVTGDWDADELDMINSMIADICKRSNYSYVIDHSGIDLSLDMAIVKDTRKGTAGSKESLSELNSSVMEAVEMYGLDDVSEKLNRIELMKSRSRFIHGTDDWLEGADVSGRPPIFSISKNGEQLAKWNPRDGRFAFSKKSLPLLLESGKFPTVEISEGHKWKGDIFPTNIESIVGEIRMGDEVLVTQNNLLIGSARAVAPGWEWPFGPGRLAKARHRL